MNTQREFANQLSSWDGVRGGGGMKTLIIAIITLTSGGTLEVVAPSLERCESWTLAARTAQSFTITDDGGVVETVAAVECKAQEVNVPEIGEEGEWIDA